MHQPATIHVPIWLLKPCVGHRPLCERRVQEIMISDDLHDPIYLNMQGEVVDGWHRVEARKRLKILFIEVFYRGRLKNS